MTILSGFLILALIIVAIVAIIRGIALGISSLAGSRFRAYRQIAARYRGRYEHRGMSDPPTVSFGYNGSAVRVGLAPVINGQPSPPRTRVVARFPNAVAFRLELYPKGRPAPAQPPKGTRPVHAGIPGFDDQYVIHSNDPQIAAELLRLLMVRVALDELRRLAPPFGMLASVNPERLLVQVDRNLGGVPVLLETAVRDALIFHDYLRAGISSRIGDGVEIVAVGPASASENGRPICKVCGDEIVDDFVFCGQCRTPHHRDCWTFVGGCSIFGCQGKQSVPAGPTSGSGSR